MKLTDSDRKFIHSIHFWTFVNYFPASPGECWNWTGCTNNKGYGIYTLGRSKKLAHRIAYSFYRECDVDALKTLLHKCDNPKCCNPFHLEEGSQFLNVLDCRVKGRSANNKPAILPEKDIAAVANREVSALSISNKLGVPYHAVTRAVRRYRTLYSIPSRDPSHDFSGPLSNEDREFIEAHAASLTPKEISKKIGKHYRTVLKFCRANKISTKSCRLTPEQIELLKQAYTTGSTPRAIAKEFGVTPQAIVNWIKKLHLK